MPGIHVVEIVVLLFGGFWFWMLIHCLLNKSLKETNKILWLLVIFFGQILGALAYFIVCYLQKNRSVPLYQANQPYQPYRPYQPAPTRTPYYQPQPQQAYTQGYQAQQAPSEYADMPPTPSAQPLYEPYDQPRAIYPEQSQQDMG